jgi:glycine cleavage system aminomethyltransferase T/glycine/D-amino acid oxidase-like deaminating enzyme
MTDALPRSAEIVIVGGGIIGCSVAYHLTKRGVRDVILLERKQLTCGTTWHAAGLITTLRATENQTRLARYSRDLYRNLAEETGLETGFMQIGSLQLASTEAWLEEMRRGRDLAASFGVESVEITPGQVKERWPMADVSDVIAGFYFPEDGRANPTDTTQALARGARMGGASIFENVKVTEVVIENGVVVGVETESGSVRSNVVVNCAGMWARELGKKSGVSVPLTPAEHYYLVSEPIEGMHPELPILRDPGNQAYYREEAGKLMLGLFEDTAAPWATEGIPEHFCFDDLPPNWDRMTPYLERAMKRVPSMLDAGIQLFFCGPESFTPDHNYLMGKAPEVDGYFVAAGFNSLGILSAGGAGKVMANWIVDGHAGGDFYDTDLRRMQAFQDNDQYLNDRVVESLGVGYQNHWPFRQWNTARDVKRLLLHDRLLAAGACMGESAGWERPNWYAVEGQVPAYDYSFGPQNWFENVRREHVSVRSNVGMFEQSSFSKLLVQGKDSTRVLNWICSNNIDVPVGKAVYTQWLNDRGGIEADLTVTRMASDKYLIVTAGFTHRHVVAWLEQSLTAEDFVTVTDITTTLGMLNVQGPRSRELLGRLTDTDLCNEAFPFATMKAIDIGYWRIHALRITYMGELGWELYIPSEYLAQVYDLITAEGRELGLMRCGYHALGSLRIEKAYREWAHDIGPDDNPAQAGLLFASDFEKDGGFLGKSAILNHRDTGVPQRRLVQFLLNDPKPMLYHNETILANGKPCGYLTSGMYGYSLGASVGLGYVSADEPVTAKWLSSQDFSIRIAGVDYSAIASLRPLYDPKSERVKQ